MDDSERRMLGDTSEAIVGVDDEGTIISASRQALRLLRHDSLEGKPLLTIIPQRLRARHEAGFARYVRTGVSRLEGHPVRVPALCGDGSEVEIDLTIRVFRRPDGTVLALAGLDEKRGGRPAPGLIQMESRLQNRAYELI